MSANTAEAAERGWPEWGFCGPGEASMRGIKELGPVRPTRCWFPGGGLSGLEFWATLETSEKTE